MQGHLLTRGSQGEYLKSEYDVARCSYKLLSSGLFAAHADYVRRQIVYGLLQVREPPRHYIRPTSNLALYCNRSRLIDLRA